MIVDVNESLVYKDGKDIEIPILETDRDGNPIFDIKKERDIYLCPVHRKRGIPSIAFFDKFITVNGQEEPLYEYETDPSGEYIYEKETGRRKIRTTSDGKNMTYTLLINPYMVKRLRLPDDKWLLEQLLKCPTNASVQMVNGISTLQYTQSRDFFIFDPLHENKRRLDQRALVTKAFSHAQSLNTINELQITHLVLFKDAGAMLLQKVDLQIELETEAQKNPKNYIEQVIDNPSFELEGLIQLAMVENIVYNNESGEYMMRNAGGKDIPLGLSEASAILYLRENSSIKNILVKAAGFSRYYSEKEIKKKSADNFEVLTATTAQAQMQIEELMRELNAVKAELANKSGVHNEIRESELQLAVVNNAFAKSVKGNKNIKNKTKTINKLQPIQPN